LLPGDVVDLAGAATFLFIDVRPGSNQTAAATVSNVIVATVPSTTTFTLQGVWVTEELNSGTLNHHHQERSNCYHFGGSWLVSWQCSEC
jgi:hypothetical protein